MPATRKPAPEAVAQHATACLISDLHLDESRPAVTAGFAGLIGNLRQVEALYILGDLFEAWIGDDDDRPLVREVEDLLRDIGSRAALYIMPGNRDFLMGDTFCHRVHATLLPDPTVHRLAGEATLLMHGDSLCTGDADYQSFRRMTRNPDWQATVLATSLTERRQLAEELRAMSTDANSMKAEDIMDVDPSTVDASMRSHDVRRLIHGHTHRPAQHETAEGTRWVLGDWDEMTGWRLDAAADGLVLRRFSY